MMNSFQLVKPYFTENRLRIVIGVLCLIAVDFCQLIIPRIVKWAVDDLTGFRTQPVGLLTYAGYIVATALLMGVFRYLWRRNLIGLSRLVEEGLRNRLFSHLQTLSARFFDTTATGNLMAHATNDINHIRMATGMGVVAMTDAVVLGAAAVGFMAYIHVQLTLLVLIPAPLIIFGTRFFSRQMHQRYQSVQAAFSELTEVARERFAGIRIIKAYTREQEAAGQFSTMSGRYIRENLRLVRITGSFYPMMLLFSNLSMAIVLFVGGRQTILNAITPGDFVAFMSYLGLLTWPMMAMGWVTNLIQRGKASLDRVDRILRTQPEITDPDTPKALGIKNGDIEFDRVDFRYGSNGDSPNALQDVSFHLKPGGILGVVGPPGSGKTTLVNLIPRLFDASRGQIRIDGTDIRDYRVEDLRASISFMPQEPFLFAGTIRENIAFGAPDADGTTIERAVKEAALDRTIRTFPAGLDTVVGEKGVILSGGQKQRVALARALMLKRAILILDDPISQVDAQTGHEIVHTLQSVAEKQTLIIVSHRLSAVRFADRILTLDQGRVSELGTHDDLMRLNGYYAATFRLQQIEEELHAY